MLETLLRSTSGFGYFLYAYFLIIGIKGKKQQVVSLSTMTLLPILITIFSFYTNLNAFKQETNLIYTYVVAVALGTFLGKWLKREYTLSIDPEKKLARISGSSFTLILLSILITVRLTMNALTALSLLSNQVMLLHVILLGMIAGVFLGRLLALMRAVKQADHLDITPS